MARHDSTECPDCGHMKDHYLVAGTKINTHGEAYACSQPGCRCVRRADDIEVPKGLIRVDGVWDYAKNAHKYSGSGRFRGMF